MNSYPKVILTTGNNKGRKCAAEVLNRVIPYDENARVEEEVRNVISVYSKLDPLTLYGLLRSAPPSSAFKIFPLMTTTGADAKEAIKEGIITLENKKIQKFYVECYKRGGEINCRELEIGIGMGMRGKGTVNYTDPDSVLFINVMRNFIGLSVLKKGQEKLSASTLKLNI
ncbi:THUMP domain-containing protein [Sulfuracidifex tepidarius]|uniref:THUMP domain-containing protein n=1 Tax=Sulfuracidifex tepidarius TaxID=1294262 RepID=A0A510E2H6_9CREN|nr:THUMP domain-containing protein [Sulfuracidifex tepidarius]BBG23956.1 hypothetical protein IC006_1254 [Sulfuracidifex tepidarius]BBG26711.1 hypothetical protein IC007_1229 [Sulfuracidifex tepidarius]